MQNPRVILIDERLFDFIMKGDNINSRKDLEKYIHSILIERILEYQYDDEAEALLDDLEENP